MKDITLTYPLRVMIMAFALIISNAVVAQTVGSIEGRIQNSASSNFLGNARVTIEGTSLETFTSDSGDFRLPGVPSGEAVVSVSYRGFQRQSKAVTVVAGQIIRQDFSLRLVEMEWDDDVVELDEFTVTQEQLSTEALAMNEQRVADNIKSVVSFEEFGNMGEGNPGEFLKYVPGVYVTFGPAIATRATIRGFPGSGTLVMVDGSPIASSSGDRTFELTGASTGNIDRLEVTKSPTPDMPANAIGGAINIKGKSAFSVSKPVLKYSTYFTFNRISENPSFSSPSFSKQLGAEPRTTVAPIQPGFDLTYLLPVNDTVGFTFSASSSKRYYDQDYNYAYWNLAEDTLYRTMKRSSNPLYERQLISGAMDWKIGKHGTLRLTTQYSSNDSSSAQADNSRAFGGTSAATSPDGDQNSTQGKANRATIISNAGGFKISRNTALTSLSYKHLGDDWKFELNGSYSVSERRRNDMEAGFFSGMNARYTKVTLDGSGFAEIGNGLLPRVDSATKGGNAINVFDAGDMALNGSNGQYLYVDNNLRSARFSAERTFDTEIPFKVKVGLSVTEDEVDRRGFNSTYALKTPASLGAKTARNLGLLAEEFSATMQWRDIDGNVAPTTFISPAKLFGLYESNPDYFVLNESSQHTRIVNGSRFITEQISAAFVRFDTKLLNDRLRIVTGVRYEKTEDDALGPLDDITRTFQKDSSGNILTDPNGNPIKLAGSSLDLLRLRKVERGSETKRDYDGFYPSMNATYSFSDALLLRAAYARTIARPNYPSIIPNINLPDSTDIDARTIKVTNSGLTAATSDSFDLSLEYYGDQGTFLSGGVFHKKMSNFISSISTTATQELLDIYGIPSEYLDYDIATQTNLGDADVTGAELAVRQPLMFLPEWARGLSLFANGTFLKRGGEHAEDLNEFAERTFNGGLSFTRSKLQVKLNVHYTGKVQLRRISPSAVVPVDTFRYVAPQTIVDLSIDYRLRKWLSFYVSAQNLGQSAKVTAVANADTPAYARGFVFQRVGARFTVGMKGTF